MELGLDRLPWYGQIGVFALVALLSVLAVRGYYIGPHLMRHDEQREELVRQQAELVRAQRDRTELQRFAVEVESLNRRLESIRVVLPEEEEVSELLRRLQAFAVQSNLTIRAFRPQAAVIRDLHSEWPYRLELDGTFHNLVLFFDRISRFARLINISDITIRAQEPSEPNVTIRAECTATTFVLLDAAAAQDAAVGS